MLEILRCPRNESMLLFTALFSLSLIPFFIARNSLLLPHTFLRIYIYIYKHTLQNDYFLNRGELVDADADASEEGEADVLLGQVSILGRP